MSFLKYKCVLQGQMLSPTLTSSNVVRVTNKVNINRGTWTMLKFESFAVHQYQK